MQQRSGPPVAAPAPPLERPVPATSTRAGTSGWTFAGQVAALTAAAYLPVLVTAREPAVLGWVAVLAVGVVAGLLLRRRDPGVAIAALLPATALVSTGLVQHSSEYMPAVACATAFAVGWAAGRAERRAAPAARDSPPLALAVFSAYLSWAALATSRSVDWRVSAVYLVGMAAVLALAFGLAPAHLASERARRRFLWVLVAIGIVSALAGYAGAALGPISIFPGQTGQALLLELTLHGHPTGLIVPWVSGLYLAQGAQYQALVIGLAAALGARAGCVTGGRRRLTLAVVVMLPAALLTFSRAGWLMVAAAGAVVGLGQLARRRVDALPLWLGAAFALLAAALVMNQVGGNARFDLQAARGWSQAATPVDNAQAPPPVTGVHGTIDPSAGSQVRGGADLSSRAVLWLASADAVRKRPLTGYGPGLDAVAIAPFIKSSYASYRGVTSHSTWLRTAVEMGVPGLALLVLVWLTVAGTVAIGWLRGRPLRDDPTLVALIAIVCALFVDQAVETYLLGGLTSASVVWALALGVLCWAAVRSPGS